jgi:hypothetical protein
MGGGVGWLAVNGLRRRRRAAVAIALLVGVVGSIVLAPSPALAGATRRCGARVCAHERRVLAIPAFAAEAHATPQIIAEAIGGPTRPPEIDRLRNTVWIAPALAGLMSVLALIALAHALVTTARRRRHELAVLKALGFDRAQVRVTLA